ncbi:hypothetical protein PCE1_003529 [Barthelona sp. PCE]
MLKFLILAVLVLSVSALHFNLPENKQMCFVEELADHQMFAVLYHAKTTAIQGTDGHVNRLGGHIEIRDPDGKIIQKPRIEDHDRIVFTTSKEGRHQICFWADHHRFTKFLRQISIDFEFKYGADAIDYEAVAESQHFDELATSVYELHQHSEDILKEYTYLKHREKDWRATSDHTSSRVKFWLAFEIILMLGCTYIQIRHFKQFLRPFY